MFLCLQLARKRKTRLENLNRPTDVFAVTMLLLSILRLTIVFWPSIADKEYYGNLLFVATVFAIVNSSVNPVIYSLVSRDFRKGINNVSCRPNMLSVRII